MREYGAAGAPHRRRPHPLPDANPDLRPAPVFGPPTAYVGSTREDNGRDFVTRMPPEGPFRHIGARRSIDPPTDSIPDAGGPAACRVVSESGTRARSIRMTTIARTNYLSLVCTAALAAVLAAGCSPKRPMPDLETPAQVLTFVEAPPVRDGRPRFRQIFCSLLAGRSEASSQRHPCASLLWRLGDEEKTIGSRSPLPPHDPGLKVYIVPGAFSDCFPGLGAPFQKGVDHLRGLGYQVETIAVEGRSGSEHDAALIAGALARASDPKADRQLLVGYSKGVTDILHFLVAFPESAKQVAAVVSVAGAVNGSPLADEYSGLYEGWLADVLPSRCPPGDKKVLVSLSRRSQMAWLAGHALPRHVAYFSLATFTDRSNMARVLGLTYDRLAQIDPRNDGQLVYSDQVIPGSTLLGFANTDHWDIALPVRQAYPFWGRPASGAHTTEFPKDVLLEALVLYAIEQLQHKGR